MADLLRFSVPCKPEYVGVVRLAVSSAANTAGVDIEDIEDIKIAVSEVCMSLFCNNASTVSYQVACELEDGKITISFDQEIEEVCVQNDVEENEVDDLYKALSMMNTSSEFDMGIMLLKALMDEVDVMSDQDTRTLIRLIKYFG